MSLTQPTYYFPETEEEEKTNIINGYPITKEPFHDRILKYQQNFKIMPDKFGFHTFALTFASKSSLGLAQKQSLEMFRQLLLIWFANDPVLLKKVESELPKNVIAISVAQPSFVVGRWCQGFELQNRYKSSKDQTAFMDQELSDRIQNRFKPTSDQKGFWTYQKLSESIQCTYYNENGVQFLAGICLYPAPLDRPMFLGTNPCLTGLATSGAISYPLADREESYNFVNLHRYGRYCAAAGKYVAVEVSENDGIPRHMEFDFNTQRNKRVLCDECAEEYHSYTWEEPEKNTPVPSPPMTTKGYPFAKEPFIPDILKYQQKFTIMSGAYAIGKPSNTPAIGISYAPEDTYLVPKDRLATIQQLLYLWFKNDKAVMSQIDLMRSNMIAISVPQKGFVVGRSCQEFKLQNEKTHSDGHFTYRKMSESVHCTYYNANGIQTLAGICLFPALHGMPVIFESDQSAPTPTDPSASTEPPPPFSADQTPLFSRANSMESLLNGFEMIGGIGNNISRASSIGSLLNEFEKIGGISDNESEIDFEVI
ncbi:unnamed protein product [Caenorhabditis brenneri]